MNIVRVVSSIVLILFIISFGFSQSEGDYRTTQSGNWSDVGSWEVYSGSDWEAAVAPPSSTDGVITILATHTITVDGAVTADQLIVDSNAVIQVASTITLTIADGADSVDMVIYGTLNEFGTVSATGRISIENGGLLIYSVPAGGDVVMPNYSWRTGSTCRIDSTTGTTPTNLRNQSLYNLIWNGTTSGANGGPNFNDGTIVGGDVTLLSTKNVQWRVTNLSAGQTKTITIKGNLSVTGSDAFLTSTGSGADSSAKAVVNIEGNINISAGTWSLVNSSNAYAEWRVKGNVNITGGTLTSGANGWAGRRTLNFNGGTNQTFTFVSPATMGTAPTTFKVSNNSTVTMGFPFTLLSSSRLYLESGTFVTSSTNLITIPAAGTAVGGNSTSFVDGPLAMVIASTSLTTRTFPIGKDGIYRPVILNVNQDASTATTYTAELFNTPADSNSLPYTLKEVSAVRHYSISKGSGANLSPTLGATVQLSYDVDDLVSDSSQLRVAKDDGAGYWINLGGSGTASGTGTITSNAFYSFSDFVLATADTNAAAALPTVVTTSMSYISITFASSGGNITNDGGAAVSARGVCWNTSGSPTIADDKTSNGVGAGVFTSSVTGLTPGVTYYLRAYATNEAGTGYGNELTFTTLASVIPPTVTTTSISNIQVTTAVSGGNVTDWGGDSVTVRGICWNTSGSPTASGSHTVDGKGLGSYASGLSLLTGGTAYYVRAYATNSSGTGYGNEIMFTTQTPQPDTTVIVASDGSGDYLTVQAAFRAVQSNYTGKWTIFVKKGTYYEKDTLVSGKINVILQGEDRDSTIITYDDYADSHGSGVPGTSGSFTIAIDASDFIAKDITFRNTYSPQIGVTGTQAVALRTQGDRHEYYNCKILGYQDTYYTWGGNGTGRMYHRNCYIEGTVDFIFGRNIVVFDSCTIREIRNTGTLTAGATDAASKYGYVFRNCTILADSLGYDGNPITTFYLGRPWQASPRTVFLNSYEPANLNTGGWQAWNVTPALYAEFNCFGPGSPTGSRINFSSQLTGLTASEYSLSTIFARSSASSNLILYDWMPSNPMSDLPLNYRITSSAGSNGTILANGLTNNAYGSSRTFSIIADSNYHVSDLLVDGISVGAETSYTFTNITDNHTISATFDMNVYTTITASAGTHGSISPEGAVEVVITANQQFTITPDTDYRVDSLLVDEVLVDSTTSYTFHNISGPHTIRVTFTLNTVSFAMNVNGTWNMLSLPVTVDDARTSVLFPSAASHAFTFSGGYIQKDTIENRKGYWLNFGAGETIPIVGFERFNDTMNLEGGWGMIGSISTPVPINAITEIPGGIVSSFYFGYDSGYNQSDSIFPGKAYWVKTTGAGKLVLNSEVVSTSARKTVATVTKNFNSLTITDNRGRSMSLYFGKDEQSKTNPALFEMPPFAPAGSFDIRFTSQRFAELYSSVKVVEQKFPIALHSIEYPMTIEWNIVDESKSFNLEIGQSDENHVLSAMVLKGSGNKVINEPVSTAAIIVNGGSQVPKGFSLSQNYPNPFNPTTQIKFSVEETGISTLAVYNTLGQQVAELYHAVAEPGQYYSVEFDAFSLPSGIYFYRLQSGTKSDVRKLLLMK